MFNPSDDLEEIQQNKEFTFLKTTLLVVFLSIAEMQADLAYQVGGTFGEAFDRYLNDNNNAPTKTTVCFKVF